MASRQKLETSNPAPGHPGGGVSLSSAARQPPAGHLCLLDGLRGIAALAVVMLHYQHFFYIFPGNRIDPRWFALAPGFGALRIFYIYGLFAVNVFWMISGFVFAHVYCGTGASTQSFVVNRFARLYPLHLLTLLVMAGLQGAAVARLGYGLIYDHNTWENFLLHLSFASGWGFNAEGAYNEPIWSVSVEIVVYAVFWWLRPWLERRGPLAALAVMMFAGAWLLMGTHNLIVACAYYFFAGSALALAMRRLIARTGWWSLAALVLVAGGGAALASGQQILAVALGIPGLFGGLILMLVGVEAHAAPAARRAGAWIGDTTYSSYLWHIPMQVALMLLLAGHGGTIGLASHGWFLAAWLVSVLIVARISLVAYEAPMRELIRTRFAGKRQHLPPPPIEAIGADQ